MNGLQEDRVLGWVRDMRERVVVMVIVVRRKAWLENVAAAKPYLPCCRCCFLFFVFLVCFSY